MSKENFVKFVILLALCGSKASAYFFPICGELSEADEKCKGFFNIPWLSTNLFNEEPPPSELSITDNILMDIYIILHPTISPIANFFDGFCIFCLQNLKGTADYFDKFGHAKCKTFFLVLLGLLTFYLILFMICIKFIYSWYLETLRRRFITKVKKVLKFKN